MMLQQGTAPPYPIPRPPANVSRVAPFPVPRPRTANDNTRLGGIIHTFTGREFWPLDARPDEIDIRDIAHSLSMQCRYAGHMKRFYSVAEHSVLVAHWLADEGYAGVTILQGLLHDATEAYLVDVPRPLKRFMTGYTETEQALWVVIAKKFDLSTNFSPALKAADDRIIADEMSQNMARPDPAYDNPLGIKLAFWAPEAAERAFLDAFWSIVETGRL